MLTSRKNWRTRIPTILAVVMAVCVLGVVIVTHIGRSAFYDEAWVIDLARSPTLSDGVDRAVDERQPIAFGYLAEVYYISRAFGGLFEGQIWVYRLPSVAAAAALLVIVGWAGGRWCRFPVWGIIASLFLLACPMVQRYATEIKQYLLAATITIGLVFAADLWVVTRSRKAMGCWMALVVLGALSGFSTWFAIAATGMVVFGSWVIKGDRKQIITTMIIAVPILILLSLVHLWFNRHISGSGVLDEYWADQYLPLDWTWPLVSWGKGAWFFEEAWYLYRVPGQLMMTLAVFGWIIWCYHQPVAAAGSGAVVACTLIANALKLWPLGIRVNLPIVVILHLSLIAGPFILTSKIIQRLIREPKNDVNKIKSDSCNDFVQNDGLGNTRIFSNWICGLQWFGVVSVLLFGLGIIYETRTVDYEVAAVDDLLAELSDHTDHHDLVLMTRAGFVAHQLHPTSIKGTIFFAPWPENGRMLEMYLPLIREHQKSRVWFAAGHHNPEMREKWEELGQELSSCGRFELHWSGKNVAVYRFDPFSSVDPNTPTPSLSPDSRVQ